MNLEDVFDRGVGVVHFGSGLDPGGHVAAGAVELLHGFDVAVSLYGIGWLAWLEVNEAAELFNRKDLVAGQHQFTELVLAARSDGKGEIHLSFLRVVLHNFGLGIRKGCLQIASFEIYREEILIYLEPNSSALVVLPGQLPCDVFQIIQFRLSSSGKFDLPDMNSLAGDDCIHIRRWGRPGVRCAGNQRALSVDVRWPASVRRRRPGHEICR